MSLINDWSKCMCTGLHYLPAYALSFFFPNYFYMNQQTKGSNSAQQTRDTTTETWIVYSNSTSYACKYRVHKLHQGYAHILKKGCPQLHMRSSFQAHSATQACMGIRQNQFHSIKELLLFNVNSFSRTLLLIYRVSSLSYYYLRLHL